MRAAEAGAIVDLERDTDAVARLCERLDGIPLAIELAASRARSLRVAEIADRLDHMFRLLKGGRRGSGERHRTLRATLEWSHDLLDESERVVPRGSPVFAGSFSLAAAEAIGSGGEVADTNTVDLVDGLVRRSLLVPVDNGDESRFRLLEPVHQFAAEQLDTRRDRDGAVSAMLGGISISSTISVHAGGTEDDQGTRHHRAA